MVKLFTFLKFYNLNKFEVLTTKDNGIDKIKDKTELVTKFSKCIQKAQKLIPEERKNRTKISLAATAGMRLLTYNFKNVCSTVTKQTFFVLESELVLKKRNQISNFMFKLGKGIGYAF